MINIVLFLSLLLNMSCKTKAKSEPKGWYDNYVNTRTKKHSVHCLNNEKCLLRTDLNEFKNQLKSQKIPSHHKKFPIFVFFIDTLRRDHVSPDIAPTITDFYQGYSGYNAIAPATSTAHSTWSLWYSQLPHQRPYFAANKWSLGSPFLYLLKKKMGYNLHAFCWTATCYRLDKVNAGKLGSYPGQDEHLQLIFSENPNDYLDTAPEHQKDDRDHGIKDNDVINSFVEFSKNSISRDKWNQNIVYISLQGVHHPYGWIDSVEGLEYPSKKTWKTTHTNNYKIQLSIKNSYRNSVRSVDYQFSRFIKVLKDKNIYDDSLILLFSDHGHSLFDIGLFNDHGDLPFDIETNISVAIKYPNQSKNSEIKKDDTIISLMDVFPTIFRKLGVDLSIDALLGRDITSEESRDCQVSFEPTYGYLTNFAFIKRDTRVLGVMNKENYQEASSLSFFDEFYSRNKKLVPRWDNFYEKYKNCFLQLGSDFK